MSMNCGTCTCNKHKMPGFLSACQFNSPWASTYIWCLANYGRQQTLPSIIKKKGLHRTFIFIPLLFFFFLHGEKKKHVPTVTSTKTRKYFWTHQMTLGEFSPETCSIVFHEIWNNHWFQQCADWAVIIYTCPLMTQSLMHGIHTHLKYIIIYSQYLLLSCIY